MGFFFLIKRSVSDRITVIPRPEDLRTDVGFVVIYIAVAVIGPGCKMIVDHPLEGFLDPELAKEGVLTEPPSVSGRGVFFVDTIKETVGIPGIDLGFESGEVDVKLLV